MEPQAAKLCARCKILEFDERKVDGSAAVTETGSECLVMPKQWRRNPAHAIRRSGEFWELPVDWFRPVIFIDSFPSLPALEASAQSGCELCRLVRDTIQPGDDIGDRIPVSWRQRNEIREFLSQHFQCRVQASWIWCSIYKDSPRVRAETGCLFLKVTICKAVRDKDGGLPNGGLTLLMRAEATKESSRLSKWLRIATSTTPGNWSESSAAKWSKSLIHDCVNSHRHAEENFRPKRLIDIQSRGSIKLVKSEEVEPPPLTYATLSYCWGSEIDSQAQLKTDSEEAEARLSLGFDEGRIPTVVRDAVEVARGLSIPYLWVDAICIRQDKDCTGGDWEEHAGVMHRIYGNSQVTIAATSSTSCREGFLYPNADDGPSLYLNYRSTLRPGNTGLLQMTVDSLRLENDGGLDILEIVGNSTEIDTAKGVMFKMSKWSTRGWTFQEHVASTRLLAFGRRGKLSFSCPGLCQYHGTRQYDGGVVYLPFTGQHGLRWIFRRDVTDPWETLVAEYSERSRGFSYDGDIFPALSGLARSYANATNKRETDYIAGFWRLSLTNDLLWFSLNSFRDKPLSHTDLLTTNRFSQRYICPSWSWIYCGAFQPLLPRNMRYSVRSELQQIDAHIVLAGKDPFGAISAAELRIVGRMARVSSSHRIMKKVGDGQSERPPSEAQAWFLKIKERRDWLFYLDWEPREAVTECPGIYMLLMATFKDYVSDAHNKRSLIGLLLLKVGVPSDGTSTGKEKFRRVGVFRSLPAQSPVSGRSFFGENEVVEIV